MQDHPLSTGITIPAPVLAAAASESGVAVAIKAEAPPTPPTVEVLSRDSDIPVFGGLGGVGLLDELLAGASGAMTGFAFPEGLVAMVDAWWNGGFKAARGAYLPWLPLVVFEGQVKFGLAIRKETLRRRGLIADARVRAPGVGMPEALAPVLDAHLSAIGSDVYILGEPDFRGCQPGLKAGAEYSRIVQKQGDARLVARFDEDVDEMWGRRVSAACDRLGQC